MQEKFSSVEAYMAAQSAAIRTKLQKLRSTIKTAAPGAEEVISYNMPAYKLNGILVYFAANANHTGFYPTPSAITAFKKELAAYASAKGSVQFPHDKPLPFALITKMVKFRVKENEKKPTAKKADNTTAKPAAAKQTDAAQVKAWMDKQEAGVKAAINAVRKIISAASPALNERIKWNAPSYYYKEDIVTFGPYRNNKVLLVFHHPAVVKVKSPLLTGTYKDRRLVYFSGKAEAEKNKPELIRILREIIKHIDK
jgi:uncharacterized protein YdhG (YjbR/CyaY superfamily)